MPLALQLSADNNQIDMLIDQSMPFLALFLVFLALVLIIFILLDCITRLRHRSPVDRLLRRRLR